MNNIEKIKILLDEEMKFLTDIKKQIEVKGDDMTVREQRVLKNIEHSIRNIEVIENDLLLMLELAVEDVAEYLSLKEKTVQ